MTDKEKIIDTLKNADWPLSKGDIVKILGLDKKVVDNIFSSLQKEGLIVSPARCKWELKK